MTATADVQRVQRVLLALRRARERLADPSRWTKRMIARDEAGDPVPYSSQRAVCWCLEGALMREADAAGLDSVILALRTVADAINGTGAFGMALRSVIAFNDRPVTEHADVLRVLDAAIAIAEAAS